MRLRSRINPEEQRNPVERATQHKKGANQFGLVCEFCGGTLYVDEVEFRQALTAMQEGTETPFCCDECEGEYEEVAH